MKKRTVSLYVDELKWETVKRLGFNMSNEVEKLIDILISTAIDTDDEERKSVTRKKRIERDLEIIEQQRVKKEKELERVSLQSVRFEEKLKVIEENREQSKLIRQLNDVIISHEYKLAAIQGDMRTVLLLEKLNAFGVVWSEGKLISHIGEIRKYLEGF